MIPPILTLKEKFIEATLEAYPELEKSDALIEIRPATQSHFGHYQCNSAMKLAKMLKINPRLVAETIAAYFDRHPLPLIEKLEVAGPGFINITLNPKKVAKLVQSIIDDPRLGLPPVSEKKKIVIDFSSPNTAKEMHVGHLRSTIIGDSLARLFEFMGHDVLRLNHVGDWGTAFGMLIAYMKEEVPQVLDGTEPTDLTHLVTWYKKAKKRFDSDPEFMKRSQLEVVELQGGNPESLKAWQIICEISSQAYQEIYDLLDVSLIERGESFYNPFLGDVVEELEGKGLVTLSEGAKCVFLEGFKNREGQPLPLIIQKSDRGYNYATTDLAAIRHRKVDEKADHLIYVTDAGQAQHFSMIFQTAEKAGWLDRSRVRVDHVPFGLVLGPDGKKFRTRAGETERLIDLIQNGIDRAKEIVREKNPEYSDDEVDTIAKALGVGAIKYADLSTNRTGDYVFSYDKMLRFEGNTAAYLLYSYVRVNGIKRKVGLDINTIKKDTEVKLEHPAELALGVHLLQFSEALEAMARELFPNRMTDYLYGLAERFHTFFRDCRVEGSEHQNARLLLCEAVAQTMEKGLSLLGVKTVQRM